MRAPVSDVSNGSGGTRCPRAVTRGGRSRSPGSCGEFDPAESPGHRSALQMCRRQQAERICCSQLLRTADTSNPFPPGLCPAFATSPAALPGPAPLRGAAPAPGPGDGATSTLCLLNFFWICLRCFSPFLLHKVYRGFFVLLFPLRFSIAGVWGRERTGMRQPREGFGGRATQQPLLGLKNKCISVNSKICSMKPIKEKM